MWDAKGIALNRSRLTAVPPASRRAQLAPASSRPPRRIFTRARRRGHASRSARSASDARGRSTPTCSARLDLAGAESVVVVEVDLAALAALGAAPVRFAPLPRFPASTRDLAVVVADAVPAGGRVERAVRDAAGDLAEQVTLFDRFTGGPVPAGHASLALRVVYRAADRTLTDVEVDQRHAHVFAEVEKRFGAQLRA